MQPHPLNRFGIQKNYQNKSRFNCVYSRKNLQKVKDESNVTNPDKHIVWNLLVSSVC